MAKLTKITSSSKSKKILFHVLKPTEGGRSFKELKEDLEAVGVTDIKKSGSAYIGHYGVIVPSKFEKRASKVCFG